MNNIKPTLAIIAFVLAFSIQANQNWLTSNSNADTMSISLVVITVVIIIILIINNNEEIKAQAQLIVLATTVIMVFTTTSFTNLFVLFETSIIPTIILITNIGSYPEKANANMYMIVITMISSLPIIIVIINIEKTSQTNILTMINNIKNNEETLWLMIILIFLTNLPLFLLHIWLPKAHVQAPTIGSIVLAGIMLKLGGYGVTITSNIFNVNEIKIVTSLSVISSIMITIMSLRQQDNNTVIAYSSVSHIIVILVNIAGISKWSDNATVISIVSHGLVSPLIFIYAGTTVEEQSSNNISSTNVAKLSSSSSVLWFMIIASNMSTPPTLNFMIEVEILINMMNNPFNIPLVVYIIIITMLCMTLATNFINGNNNNNSTNNSINNNDQVAWVTLIVIVVTIITSNNVAWNQESHVKPTLI